MGIFRPNKLGYTSEDVEKKSNSYIMTLVEKFVTNITDIVNSFKKDINTAVEVQNSRIDDKADMMTVINHLENKNNPHEVTAEQIGTYTKEEIGDISGHDFTANGLVSAILNNKYAIDSLGYDCSQKADKTELDLKADKATTLSGYGIEDAYNKSEVDDKIKQVSIEEVEYSDIDNIIESGVYKLMQGVGTTRQGDGMWLVVSRSSDPIDSVIYVIQYMFSPATSEIKSRTRNPMSGEWFDWKSIGSGAGAVSSVNGQVGDVELSAEDVGAYTKEEIGDMSHSHFFDGLTSAVLSNHFDIQSLGYDVYNTKADKASILITSESSLILTHNQEARLGEIATLTLSMPTAIDDLYWSSFCFASGATATSISYSGEPIIWRGDDCDAEGNFVPEANTKYEVHIKKLGSDIVARVGAY